MKEGLSFAQGTFPTGSQSPLLIVVIQESKLLEPPVSWGPCPEYLTFLGKKN